MKRWLDLQIGIIFSEGFCNQQIEVIKCGSSKDTLQVIHKVHRESPWKQATLCNRIDMLSKCGRYIGFWYADGKMIN